MHWPFMLRRTHDCVVSELREEYTKCLEKAYEECAYEYDRAMKDGKALVHAWARDVTWRIFTSSDSHISHLRAAMQDAEKQFNPKRP